MKPVSLTRSPSGPEGGASAAFAYTLIQAAKINGFSNLPR